jgi:hypothetical protein
LVFAFSQTPIRKVWASLDSRPGWTFRCQTSDSLRHKSFMSVNISRYQLPRCLIGFWKGERPKCAFSRKLNLGKLFCAMWSSDRAMIYCTEKLSRQTILPCQAISLINFRRGKTNVRAHAHEVLIRFIQKWDFHFNVIVSDSLPNLWDNHSDLSRVATPGPTPASPIPGSRLLSISRHGHQ